MAHTRKPAPVIGITMGDPAGIGPEIICKALSSQALAPQAAWVIIGDESVMRLTAHAYGLSETWHRISSPARARPGVVGLYDCNAMQSIDALPPANASARCGRAAYTYVTTAIDLALSGGLDAIVTAPINKHALALANISYEGHTEILADKTDTHDYAMTFILDGVFVLHVTTHCSLINAIERITRDRVIRGIRLLAQTLRDFGIPEPRIAVSGLNPHAGEHGLFGTEERDHITPAVQQARGEGHTVEGPLPPDTVFLQAFNGDFHGVVAMLHDHGFVALKSRGFDRCVNYTAGLPFIRTSVGHGTAFDIAGTGRASEKNLVYAAHTALQFCTQQRTHTAS